MANLIIDTTFFYGELSVGQITEPSVTKLIQMLIDEHEPCVLETLLGYELYKLFNAADLDVAGRFKDLAEGKEYQDKNLRTRKWKGLKFVVGTAKKSLVANYVYTKYLHQKQTETTGSGEKALLAAAAAMNADNAIKMARAWNQMCEWNKQLVDFLLSNEAVYPEFKTYYDDECRLRFSTLKNLMSPINPIA